MGNKGDRKPDVFAAGLNLLDNVSPPVNTHSRDAPTWCSTGRDLDTTTSRSHSPPLRRYLSARTSLHATYEGNAAVTQHSSCGGRRRIRTGRLES